MPDISVGPPHLLVHAGQTAWASQPDGQVAQEDRLKGLFFRDTRLISHWVLYVNGAAWEPVGGGAVAHFAARAFLTNPGLPSPGADIPARTLSLMLGRWLDGGLHEDIDIANHGAAPVRFVLELSLRADFADVFEAKSGRIVRRGRIVTEWSEARQELSNSYANGDFRRGMTIAVHAPGPAHYANGRLAFEIDLPPGATWHACLLTTLVDGAERLAAPGGCMADSATSGTAATLAAWHEDALRLASRNTDFQGLYRQAVNDLAALRMGFAADGTDAEGGEAAAYLVPAAGLPWFMVLFGRDSLIAAMLAAPVTTVFLRGTLPMLARYQADALDPERDAEPGKILHELRRGELAHFDLIPHTPYYGTADATPLFLMALHEAWRWTADRDFVAAHMGTAERCLEWIDKYGDRDGDGFQEYGTYAPRGYENMGWKDSPDGVLNPDGSMVSNPKALCELQGYAYAAWRGMAEIFDAFGRPDDAATLRDRAAAMFARFNATFWDEDQGCIIYALDGKKRRVTTVASNMGHCLWTGLVDHARADRVVQRLLAPDMFSGWGIRTLSASHPAYNPYSYHNGSVWPHDNALAALGFARYGFRAAAAHVAHAVTDAGSRFAQDQVPELYSGIPRAASGFPVPCLGANVPQAWAAASTFAFLRALLMLEPDAPNGCLRVAPDLPDWLPEVTLRGLHVGSQRFDLRFVREGEATRTEVLAGDATCVLSA